VKVLLLSRYDRTGASTRLRFLQYLPYLRENGVEVTTAPLLDDEYLRALYSTGGRSAARVGAAYLKRLAALFSLRQYDLVWMEKELFPRLPATLERIMGRFGVPYVVDYDDAVFHDYDKHGNPAVRLLLSRKIDQVMKHAALVVAGNDYLAARARAAGASRVEVIPTVVDLERYPEPPPEAREGFRIGWIGTPVTSRYLRYIRGPLAALTKQTGTRVSLVGPSVNPVPEIAVELRRWTEGGEVSEMREFDVGVMPLPDEPWERGKCGYKLIQYMACGKPVIASPVGVNAQIVQHGINGFLASNDAEWQTAMETIRDNPELRQRMGRAGRELVRERYCLAVTAPRLLGLLRSHDSRRTPS
jgi:glycosyltransferase involved in cell wall biosynthesis